MQQECKTGKRTGRKSNCCFTNIATYAEASISKLMNLTLFRVDGVKMKKDIIILLNAEYTISYYDADTSNRAVINGTVTNIYGEGNTNQYILLKYIDKTSTKSPYFTQNNKCGCCSGSTENYNVAVKTIPIQNIYDIQYGDTNPLHICNSKDTSCNDGGLTTVLIGIDAEIVKAITVNLKILDDQSDDAIKYIELKKDNIYDIVYCKPGNNTVYEFTGRLAEIVPVEEDNTMDDTTVSDTINIVHCGCDHLEENVGIGGSIYTSSGYCGDVNKFLSQAGPYQNVRLVFDTSERNDGTFEIVALSWIRGIDDVTPVDDNDSNIPDEEKDCTNCANNILNKGIIIYTNEKGKSMKYYPLTGRMVTVYKSGIEEEIEKSDYLTIFENIINPIPNPPDTSEPDPDLIPITPPIGETEVTPGEDDW